MSDIAAPAAPVAPAASGESGAKPAETAPVTKAAEPEPSEEYEIDGKKVSLTKTQARTYIQKSFAVDKRMQTVAEKEKAANALVAEFERDPEAAMRKAGKDPEKILQALLERKAKQATMTPEQLERAKLEEERDALKADKEKREKAEKAKADSELDQHNEKALETQLIEAADAHGLDGTPETLEELCDIALELLELGLNPSAAQVAQEFIRRDGEYLELREKKVVPRLKGPKLNAYLKANVGALLKLPAAELLEVLGPEGVKAIQEATLTKLPGPGARVAPKGAPIVPPPRNGAGRFISEAQFDKKR